MKTAAPDRASSELQQKRRSELVLAAYRQIAQRGFEGLRTRDVADEVGVNIATLHYYFPTKEALIRGVLEHAMGRFRSTLAPRGSTSNHLRDHLRAVRKLSEDEPELGRVIGELALRSSRDRSIESMLSQMQETWHATMRGMLRREVRQGRLKRELDTDGVAAVVIATLTGLMLPQRTAAVRGAQAVRQLEKWLARP